MTKYEQEMFRRLNEIRAESGLAPLEWNSEIYQYAKIRAAESSEYYKNEGVGFGPDPHYVSITANGAIRLPCLSNTDIRRAHTWAKT